MACRKMIEEPGTVMGGQCRLNLPEGHDGPCASPDMQRSMRSRREWEETGSLPVERPQGEGAPLDISGITNAPQPMLGAFQGPPQTTAERYTDNATPVPGRDQGEPMPPGTVPTRPEVDHEALLAMTAPSSLVASTSWPTKQRPEDQRLPEANDRPFAHDLVKVDLDKRLAIGISRYGQGLQAFNGRNTLLDAYEEALDQTVYLQSLLVERAEMRLAAEEVYSDLSESGGDPEVIAKARALVEWLRQ